MLYFLVLLGAVIIQFFISRHNRIAGAVSGFIITSIYLLWGIITYGQGNAVMYFSNKLTEQGFLTICYIWYALDALELVFALKNRKKDKAFRAVLNNEKVIAFYKNTLAAWSKGLLSEFGKQFETDGKMKYNNFVALHPPLEGKVIRILFDNYSIQDDEYLVGTGEGWCIITNKRLIQRDGETNKFEEIILADLTSYQAAAEGDNKHTLRFQMKSGETIVLKQVVSYIKEQVVLAFTRDIILSN